MKRGTAFAAVLAGLLVVIGGFTYFQFFVKPQMIRQFMAQAPRPVVTVTAEEVRAENWMQTLTAVGTLRAVRGVDLANQVDGMVRSINFVSGEEVAAGAPLIQIDDTVEQADLKSAIADLRRATADYERQRELVARGAVARASFDTALNQRDTAAATIERIRAIIAKKNIQAPFAGRMGIRRIDIGQYLPIGTMIATLQSMDPIYVDFPMPEQFFGVIRVGQDVETTLDAYPGEVFRGRIQSIDARVNQDSRAVLVRGEVGNADQRAVPGMFANVSVLTGNVQNVLTVPRTAVTYSLYGDNVLVVQPARDGAAARQNGGPAGQNGVAGGQGGPSFVIERRFVRIGEVRNERVAILEGVKPGERIVTTGQLKLDQGTPVRVDNTSALRAPAERPKE